MIKIMRLTCKLKKIFNDLLSLVGLRLVPYAALVPSTKLYKVQVICQDLIFRFEGLPELIRNDVVFQQYSYGYYQLRGTLTGTLYLKNDANSGLFSCLTTFIWTLIDINNSGQICYAVNNSLSMNWFKEAYGSCTWHDLFIKKERSEVRRLMSLGPQKNQHFDHHSDFHDIYENHLGASWVKALFSAYFTPHQSIIDLADLFDRKYHISSAPTIAVCYRGTDKHTEVQPTPISTYFQAVNDQLSAIKDANILIQTDQAQIRDQFMHEYGNRCKFIEELPATYGGKVLHLDHAICGDRDLFARKLCAMCLVVSRCSALITHTGNVGLFLALHCLVNNKKVVQFS